MINALFITVLPLMVSLLGLVYLCFIDPKRRRAHKHRQVKFKTHSKWAWLWTLAPLPILVLTGHTAALMIWAAGFLLIGWIVALTMPIGR